MSLNNVTKNRDKVLRKKIARTCFMCDEVVGEQNVDFKAPDKQDIWLVWTWQKGHDFPYLRAVTTSEEMAEIYRSYFEHCIKHPDTCCSLSEKDTIRVHVEPTTANHLYGATMR